MDKILEVRNLKISFRTPNGALKAVRNISFDLERGKTLAIVGESGSGKSVTSRAVMGILAGNSIVERGDILYDGMDLLKISEEDMCKIRGDRISMIFQDPLSSLNPIVKIGKQITEAMLLKDKESRKRARKNYRQTMKKLEACMVAAAGSDKAARIKEMCQNFRNSYEDKAFMDEFSKYVCDGIKYSYAQSLEVKKAILPALLESVEFFKSGKYTKAEAKARAKEIADSVEKSIDRIEVTKDSYAYSLRSAINHAIDQYFYYTKANPKEDKRYDKQSAKRERLIKRGKNVDWKVVPKLILDLDELREDIAAVVNNVYVRYDDRIKNEKNEDWDARLHEMLEYLQKKAIDIDARITKTMARETAIRLMKEVGIPEPEIRYNQYPFEFSGGMRQRIVIAIALAANPDILICDEPTTALDVTIQAQILELINKLKAERNLSVIFITHDLGVVANMADDIAVMYAGKIVEYGTAEDIFYNPKHPYTWALLSSMPDLDTKEKLDAIPGTPPNMIYPPKGDAFADRNKYAMQIDYEQEPPQFKVSDTHWAATWLLHPNAPRVEMPKIISERIARMRAKEEGGLS